MSATRRTGLWATLGPGILIAATGVGAGDLAMAGFAGSKLGTAILWAVLLGAFFKFAVTEGLARWQLGTGTTLLEGVAGHLGRGALWVFLAYLLFWSYFVGSALISACGVTFHAILPVFEDAFRAKVVFGITHSVVGVALVLAGGFRLFERVMGVCIGAMFLTVVVTAILVWPGTGEVLRGLLPVQVGRGGGEDAFSWIVALIGGVGGTVTVLCYGYWIREKGRAGTGDLALCRLDLGVGYAMTAVFGFALVIIASGIEVSGKGAALVVEMANRLEEPVGPLGRAVFIGGAWGAVFSSLLGVWQAVPYLFADTWSLLRGSGRRADGSVDTRGAPYRTYLVLIATLPMLGLFFSFERTLKLYGLVGAAFIPLLAAVLLFLNGGARRVGNLRNRLWSNAGLGLVMVFFTWALWRELYK